MDARQRLDYGRGTHSIDAKDQLDEDDLLLTLRERFGAEDYKPPMAPTVAIELMELSKQPNVTFDQIVGILEKDAMLAAEALRTAQSPAFVRRVPPRTLTDAVSRLGLDTIQNIVWQTAMSGKVFRSKRFGPAMDSVRRHSIAVAHLTRLVAAETSVPEEYAFLFGLLHDVGFAVILLAIAEIDKKGQIDLDMIAQTADELHAEAGGIIARLWNLPPDLQIVIPNHHVPVIQGYTHPLIATLVMAEAFAIELGHNVAIGSVVVDSVKPAALQAAVEHLDLSESMQEKLIEKAREKLASLGDL